MPKDKKYIIDNKLIMDRWNYSLNSKLELNPNKLTEGTHTKAHFVCPKCGYKWFNEIRYVVKYNGGCKSCSEKKRVESWIKTKKNNSKSLFITNPELEKEWDYEKNNEIGLDPNFVFAGTNKEAYWICRLNHSYKAYISNRALKRTGCTYCAGQAVLKGFNDFATTRKDLLKEWDYEKNNEIGLFPDEIMRGSHEPANWVCPLGHSYVKKVHDRDSGHGCTKCAKESQTSFPEQAIYFYVSKVFKDAKNRYGRPEIDIFIPSLNFGIEYDGLYAHKKKQKSEKKKNEILKSRKIKLIRIKETINNEKDSKNIIYCKANSNNTFLNEVIKKIEKIINETYKLNVNLNPNIQSDRIKIEEQYIFLKKQNSIGILYPEIAKEWDYEKNGRIMPEFVSYGSSKKYFWLCNKGHSYECSPKDRVHGRGCNICSGIRYIKRINDLQTKHPELIKYWDYDKNEITPDNIKYTNSDAHWWKCNKGHSYQTTIKTMLKYKCCLGCSENLNILVKGVNDLATLNPKLIEEWDYENNDKTPDCYTLNSNQEVYWVCKKCGYHWKSYINQRSICPNCKKINNKINVYDSMTLNFLFSADGITKFCEKLDVDINKQHGNISQVCHRKQKTIMGKYILRYDNDDEFKDVSIQKRKELFNYDITKVQRNNTINVYDISTAKLIGVFNDKKKMCKNLNIDYKKQHGNISTICKRKQKTLLGKYILRYDYDDEFKNKTSNERKKEFKIICKRSDENE